MPSIAKATVTFRRHVNTGNYESFEIEISQECNAADTQDTAHHIQLLVDHLALERVNLVRRAGAKPALDASELPI